MCRLMKQNILQYLQYDGGTWFSNAQVLEAFPFEKYTKLTIQQTYSPAIDPETCLRNKPCQYF